MGSNIRLKILATLMNVWEIVLCYGNKSYTVWNFHASAYVFLYVRHAIPGFITCFPLYSYMLLHSFMMCPKF